MTSDEFTSEYKLLKQIAGKGGRSYTAEHLASGRAVLVHILEDSQVGGASGLSALLERLSPRDKSRVLSTMTVDQSLVVVTQFLQGFDGFEGWLRAKTSGPAAPPPPPSGLPQEFHGEFTRLFRSSEDAPAPPAGRTPAGPASDTTLSPPAGSNFTDLFRAPAGTPPPAQGPDRATIPPVRMVGVRVPLPSEPSSVDPEPPRLTPNLGPSREPASQTEPGPPRLTPNFGPSREPPPPPDMVAGWPQPDEVIIRTGEPAPPPVIPATSWGGPSEFTRQLGSVPQPPVSQFSGELPQVAGISEPNEASAERKRSYLPLFLVLNLVFIMATGLVVYFALRRC